MAATREKKPTVTTAGSSSTITIGGAFTTIQEIVTFEKELEKSKFIVKDPRATHNCCAYKVSNTPPLRLSDSISVHNLTLLEGLEVGDQYRSSDDGEPSGTAGKPIHSSVAFSGLDKVMVVVIRAYGGVTSECLKNAPICLVKSKARKQLKILLFQYIEILIFDWNFRKVPMGVEVPFDLSRVLYLVCIIISSKTIVAEDIKQDYDTGEDGIAMVSFKVDFDRLVKLEETIKANFSRELVLSRNRQDWSVI
ncbi:IMPACT family member in pol 5'region [Gossypium australe]|uniref:IMPACT family member in pol 5'region n=1 Tax=Gossypium australe TaxID=47621 RepID=A0A5B6W4P4_9ROSI|nr:IMPACT family member in pol 5'region [Gossypium australe]